MDEDTLNVSPHARSVLLGDRRCTALNRAGGRCGRASALGQFVCDHHGAKAPLSIQAGRERMAALVEPAMEVLFRATRNAPPCEVCGRSDSDRDPTAVRAAGMILDRCGYHPKFVVEHERPQESTDWVRWMPTDRLEQIAAWMDEARQLMQSGVLPDPHPDTPQLESAILDADVVAADDEVEI
jgi:hypothetical protein